MRHSTVLVGLLLASWDCINCNTCMLLLFQLSFLSCCTRPFFTLSARYITAVSCSIEPLLLPCGACLCPASAAATGVSTKCFCCPRGPLWLIRFHFEGLLLLLLLLLRARAFCWCLQGQIASVLGPGAGHLAAPPPPPLTPSSLTSAGRS